MKRQIVGILVRPALAAAAGALLVAETAAQSPCDCTDVLDLQARYCQARGAVEEWDRLIGVAEKKRPSERYTVTNKDEVAVCVDEAMTRYRQRFQGNQSSTPVKTSVATAETDNRTCEPKVKAPTKCLEDVLDKHEQQHVDQCKAIKKTNATAQVELGGPIESFIAKNINWRLAYSLTSYMIEEKGAYTSEMADILDKLKDLKEQKKCKADLFERQTRKGMMTSLTPCPSKPDPKDWDDQKCKR